MEVGGGRRCVNDIVGGRTRKESDVAFTMKMAEMGG